MNASLAGFAALAAMIGDMPARGMRGAAAARHTDGPVADYWALREKFPSLKI